MMLRARLSGLVSDLRTAPLVPVLPRHDDLYLVEFPKSGVTWLCYLFANTNILLTGSKRRVSFFNLNELVPDIHVDRHLAPPSGLPGFRCIKSHSGFIPQYKRVFYLVRDPRNVIPSYYNFITELGWWTGSQDAFVNHTKFGVAAWKAHVDSWLDRVEASTSFALVRYEDLLTDAGEQLRRLYGHLGFDLPDSIITEAVARSSAEQMRTDETIFNAAHPKLKSFNFVRRDKISGARTAMPDALKRHIEMVAGETMRRLGYTI